MLFSNLDNWECHKTCGELFGLEANALLSAIIGREYWYLTFKRLSERKHVLNVLYSWVSLWCIGLHIDLRQLCDIEEIHFFWASSTSTCIKDFGHIKYSLEHWRKKNSMCILFKMLYMISHYSQCFYALELLQCMSNDSQSSVALD